MDPLARFRGAMLGLAVGDALGAPVEGLKGGHIRQLYGEVDGYLDPTAAWRDRPGHWRQPGLYTDDAQQALALADVLVKCRGFEAGYFARLLVELAQAETGGHFGAHRGTGHNFRATVRALVDGAGPLAAGTATAGVGAMMRAAPCGLYHAGDDEATIKCAIEQGLITHRDPRSLTMAALAAVAAARGVTGAWDKTRAGERAEDLARVAQRADELVERGYLHLVPIEAMDRFGLASSAVKMLPRLLELPEEAMIHRQIVGEANRQFPAHKITEPGQGFVMASGLSALYIIVAARDYEDGVKRAIHLGKDTDTMAAIVGAALGARFGEDAIPPAWRSGLVNAEQVALRGEALFHKNAAGLGQKDLVKMETELTRAEVAGRETFVARMAPSGETGQARPKKPKAAPEPARAETTAFPPPSEKRPHDKRQKPKRVKAPWKG